MVNISASSVALSSQNGLLQVGLEMPTTMSKASHPTGKSAGSRGGPDSDDSCETSDTMPRAHHLKLLALSAELMRAPAGRMGNESSAKSVGLVEEARNRRRGRKERCVHWDRVEINGREFPLQRADTSVAPPVPAARFTGSGGGKSELSDETQPSYVLVAHTTCDMCLMTFESSSVSGVVTMKRIMEARRDWGMAGAGGKKYAAASNLYEPARLCALCSQFFCSKATGGGGEGEFVPRGVGRSEERVSLTLESMASNKPLPDKATATAIAAASRLARSGRHQKRRALSDDSKQDAGRSTDGSGSTTTNFHLDELIADDHFVVKETDLARQPGATATQSSTADGMGADVCMGFPATKRQHEEEKRGDLPGTEPTRTDKPNMLLIAGEELATPTVLTRDRTKGNTVESTRGTGHAIRDARSTTGDDAIIQQAASSKRERASAVARSPVVARAMSPDEVLAAASAAARTCSRTRRENQPWWEIDLGAVYPVRCIRVHHPDRRTEATKAGTSPFVDVAPFWMMTAAWPFGEAAPEEAKELAISAKRVGSHGKVTSWDLGANHFATTVRVQAEGVKSLQLARVEVIKGGGTQQAKDVIQQQLVARDYTSYLNQDSVDGSSGPQMTSTSAPTPSKSRRVSEHTTTTRRLQRFYLEIAEEAAGKSSGQPGASMVKPITAPGVAVGLAVTAPVVTTAGGGETGRLGVTATVPNSLPSLGREASKSFRAQTCPVPAGGSLTLSGGGVGDGRRQTSGRGRRRKVGLQGEDVKQLLLRAMVGYDWVDEFNGQELRVRGAFTEQDVGILEEIFFRCALGDDVEARATATVSDPFLRLDPGELCGDLRRLQLQVQTNTSGKNKTPMLLAVRESPNLFQLLYSGVVETLPDALARAEAHIPPEQRPLCLDWTRFLGVMGLCLEGAHRGTGAVVPSAVACLFEETHDEKLDFLTRKRSRLPPPSRKVADTPGRHRQLQEHDFSPGGTARGSGDVTGRAETAATTAARGTEASSTEHTSFYEGTSIDTGDDPIDISLALGSGGSARRGQQEDTGVTRGREDMNGGRRGARGGGDAALKSLLRPQARHEVFRAYGEALSKRRGRQRGALSRAKEPDIEPTRAYKPCGLCQAPFPVESLGATVSLKVLGSFLARAGAPSERFERKASRLCALHRLPLCVFCSQFFDPDFPGGIVPPGGYSNRRGQDGGGDGTHEGRGRTRRPASANGLVSFFDDRFPDRWAETPLPSSAPAQASSRFRPGATAGEEGFPVLSTVPTSKLDGVAGRRVQEAKGLREVGRLVRGGCSIRDRLSMLARSQS